MQAAAAAAVCVPLCRAGGILGVGASELASVIHSHLLVLTDQLFPGALTVCCGEDGASLVHSAAEEQSQRLECSSPYFH